MANSVARKEKLVAVYIYLDERFKPDKESSWTLGSTNEVAKTGHTNGCIADPSKPTDCSLQQRPTYRKLAPDSFAQISWPCARL